MRLNHNWLIAAGCCALLACSDPQQDWEAARLTDTQQAYTDFLEAHPQGNYAQRARTRIEELEREQAWEDTQKTATAAAYAAFLEQYPAGAHSREARQQVDDMEREGAWNRLRAQEGAGLDDLRAFIVAYPQSVEADQARTMVATLEARAAAESNTGTAPAAAAPNAGTVPAAAEPATRTADSAEAQRDDQTAATQARDVRVQLGAFRSRDTAEAERKRLQQAYGDALGDVVVESADTDPALFRVRSAPMARELARNACAALAEDDQACIVVAL
jgi:cell division septation protein DedD